MTVGIRILVWKEETNRTTAKPDYTIEIEGGEINLLNNFVLAVERIARALEEKRKNNKINRD